MTISYDEKKQEMTKWKETLLTVLQVLRKCQTEVKGLAFFSSSFLPPLKDDTKWVYGEKGVVEWNALKT